MSSLSRLLSKAVATVFFVGYLPFAPGTFGALAGMVFIWLLKPATPLLLAILGTSFAAGVVSAHYAEKAFGVKDCGHIVIDEFVGILVSVAFLPQTAGHLVSAFLLFRFFDILKPPPIRNIERALSGGMGIMLDDVAAGIATNAVLQLATRI